VPKVRLLFVGTGDNEDELKRQVKLKGLEKYFEFTGHVTNVKDYMNQSNIVVHTSIEPEPFGMVIIEAMALEKPVIATNIGGPLEIIDHEKDGFLIPPLNPVILAEYIVRLAKDADLRMKIGKKAREKVIAKFEVRSYTRQIESIYDELSKPTMLID
jgi:glycosyltransferase involved in cell wall biosynthesis